jgi:hypothetical protein
MLYVFSDGARNEDDVEGVEKVREIVSTIDWTEPVVAAHEQNVGLSASIRSGMDSLLDVHDAAIVIEDDVCVAPEFYDYVRAGLWHYRDSERVAGITGLRYPFDRRVLADYPYDAFLSPRFSSWGWATWRDRWSEICFDRASLRRQISEAPAFEPERAGADMPGMVREAVVTETLTGSWDVVCAASMLLRGQYFLTPTWNMVENTGLDEGTHFDQAPHWELRWEPDHGPRPGGEIRFPPIETDERVLKEYRRFFAREGAGRGTLARARVAAARWRTMRRSRRAGN